MLGHLALENNEIDGCTPNRQPLCSNPLDPLDAESKRYPLTGDAVYEQNDPGHSIESTAQVIYGYKQDELTNKGSDKNMEGFVRNYVEHNNGDEIWTEDYGCFSD